VTVMIVIDFGDVDHFMPKIGDLRI
jgi:hypothetical protein